MDIEALAETGMGRLFIRIMAGIMESRLRYRFFAPNDVLEGADILPGQDVLEVGCGTGYFTIPLARLLGGRGSIVAMDILQGSVDIVSAKVEKAGLQNIRVVKGDALNTGLRPGSFDRILLFGVIPAPMLSMPALMGEMHRVLRPGGVLAVWPHVPYWMPGAVLKTGYFEFLGRRGGVNKFGKRDPGGISRQMGT